MVVVEVVEENGGLRVDLKARGRRERGCNRGGGIAGCVDRNLGWHECRCDDGGDVEVHHTV